MYVDDAGLQGWAEPGTIETAASDLTNAGGGINAAAEDARTAWLPLTVSYTAPEAATVHSALDRVATDAADIEDNAGLAAAALNDFAAEIRALTLTRDTLLGEIRTNNAKTYTDQVDEETTYFNLTGRTKDLVLLYGEAVYRCADRINGVAPAPLSDTSNLSAGNDYNSLLYSAVENNRLLPYYRSIAAEASDAWGRYRFSEQLLQSPMARYGHRVNGLLRPPTGLIHPEQWGGSVRSGSAAIPAMSTGMRWGGRALGAAGVGLTVYGEYGDQYNEDIVAHPEWSESERQRSAVTSAVVVGGSAAAGGWAGAAVGAQWGATIGMAGGPVGAVVGGIVGGAIGGYLGSEGGAIVGEAIMEVGSMAEEAWNSLWD